MVNDDAIHALENFLNSQDMDCLKSGINCNCSVFCYALLYVHSSNAIILMGKRELVALLNLSSWCLLMVEGLFFAVPWGCLRFVIVVFPCQTHLLFLIPINFADRNAHILKRIMLK